MIGHTTSLQKNITVLCIIVLSFSWYNNDIRFLYVILSTVVYYSIYLNVSNFLYFICEISYGVLWNYSTPPPPNISL